MKNLFLAFACLLNMSCHAEWRTTSEVFEDLSSEDSVIRELVNGEFGYSYPDNKHIWLHGSNDISEHVRVYESSFIQQNLKFYKVACTFSYFPRPGYHHWVVFLDENREFLLEFQFPDCRQHQWIKLTKPVFEAIKYFVIEERFGPLLSSHYALNCCTKPLYD